MWSLGKRKEETDSRNRESLPESIEAGWGIIVLKTMNLSNNPEKVEPWGLSRLLLRNPDTKLEVGVFKCSPGKSMDMHVHRGLNEIIYVIEGTVNLEDEVSAEKLQSDSAAVISKDVMHRAFNESAKECKCLYILYP